MLLTETSTDVIAGRPWANKSYIERTANIYPPIPIIPANPPKRRNGLSPIERAKEDNSHSTMKEQGKTRGVILVVDDDQSLLSTVTDILEFEDYTVETAANGAEALRVLEQVRPQLILLDMRMPILNGWDFAAILKERNIQIPILVMTAAHDARRWAEEIEAEGYVSKPFDLLELLDAIDRLRIH